MPWKIEIHRAKPNPAGKDRAMYPLPQQLLGEWVDLKNIGDQAIALSALHLAHTEYEAHCRPKSAPSVYWNGSTTDILHPGWIVRVHTGKSSEQASMATQDRAGVNIHAFAEKGNFVLNNACGDGLSVWWIGQDSKWYREDSASYAPNTPDGAVLVRTDPNWLR